MKLPKINLPQVDLSKFRLPKIHLPNDKKQRFAIIFLGFGGVLIALLLGILLYASYTLKSSLEGAINSYLENLKEDIFALDFVPFACSGVANISCASPYIAIADTLEASEVSLGFGRLGDTKKLDMWAEAKEIIFIKSTDAHSLLRVFFALPKVDLSGILFPTYIKCEVENVLLESSTHTAQKAQTTPNTLQSQNLAPKDSRTHIAHIAKCNLNAQNMSYSLKAEAEQSLQIPQESTQSIKDALTHIYKSYASAPNAFMEESRIWIDSANLTLKPNKLDFAIMDFLKNQNSVIAQNPQDKTQNELAEKALKEQFDKAIKESANIATYTFSFVSTNRDTRKAIMEGVNGFSNLLQGQSTQASYEFLPKHTRYFRLSDIISAPSAVLNLANFSLKVAQNPKEQNPKNSATNPQNPQNLQNPQTSKQDKSK